MGSTRIDWDEKFRLGIDQLDDDHKKILGLLAKANQTNNSDAAYTLREFVKIAQAHFQAEEAFMEIIRFPYISEHKSSHDKLKKSISQLMAKMMTEEISPQDIVQLLHNYITTHLTTYDAKIKDFLNQKK